MRFNKSTHDLLHSNENLNNGFFINLFFYLDIQILINISMEIIKFLFV